MDRNRADDRSPDRAAIDLPYSGVESKRFRVSPKMILLALSGAILVIVISLVVLSNAKRCPHRYIRCAMHLSGFGAAAETYYFDRNRESYPPDLDTLVALGFIPEDGDQCPTYRAFGAPTTGYHYVTGLSRDDPGDWMLAFDDPDNSQHGKINVLLVNGKVESLSDSDFTDRLTRFYRDYGKARGHPPAVIPPAGLAPPP